MKIQQLILSCIIAIISFTSCKRTGADHPKISFDSYKIADGFEIQLAASEPLIEAPVAMDFDDQGRMWVVEMRGFMPNLAGTGDTAANGRISILEDDDHDGVADRSVTFLDSLVLPRAISHVYGGLLYTTPPFLWFAEIKNDKPGKITLVDSSYADGGSPEAQPNGLMMNIDNWIYSANAQFRYQLRDGKWMKEPTSFRGQFGITKDNVGRLYYNYNEVQIAGDYVLPNTLINNPYFKPKEGINKLLTENQRVYPLHPTTVNRGYANGILNKDSLLLNVTAACGPLIYRGDQFPGEYSQNAFACEPQANLVKRNIVIFADDKTTAVQAWNDREFLASTDEGFRPVNLFNGPDGEMYVVDMHRGVMEYRAFTTPYYNNGIEQKKLDTLLNAGRILRIKSKDKEDGKIPDLISASTTGLVSMLSSPNGWIRDRAQQVIINRQDKSVIPALERLASDAKNAVPAIHALYTLEGLHALTFESLQKVAALGEPMLCAHALSLLQKFSADNHLPTMKALVTELLNKDNPTINLYLALSLGPWNEVSNGAFLPVLEKISDKYQDKTIYQEAIVSSLKGFENEFQKINNKVAPQKSKILDTLLAETMTNKHAGKMNSIFVQMKTPPDARTNGLAIFRSTCANCHGNDGDGIEHVAPPLKGSEYVEGSPNRLAMIILNGLEGPIHINGKLYTFNGSMPNFANNYNDKDIADIVEYLHNAYVTKPVKPIQVNKVKELRNITAETLQQKDLVRLANVGN